MPASNAAARAVTVAAMAVCLVAVSPSVRAQSQPLPPIVAKIHVYLDTSESKLSALVADELFEQRIRRNRLFTRSRRLVSDIGFLRLPGGLAWLAQRSVGAHPAAGPLTFCALSPEPRAQFTFRLLAQPISGRHQQLPADGGCRPRRTPSS